MMDGKNALSRENPADPNSPPVYDLSGDRVCIALLIIRDGKKLNFACHLRPPTAERTIRLLRDRSPYAVPSREKDGGVDESLRGSAELDRAFFDEHRVAVTYGGQALTVEQLDRIDRINNIRVNAISRGLLVVGNPNAAEVESDSAPTLEELLEESPRVEQHVLLADDNGAEHTLKIVHHFALPTAAQSIAFQRTVKLRTILGGAQKILANHKEIGKLYDDMIQRVDGVVGDRAAIIRSLPFVWKFNAIQMLFRDAERKNV